MGWSSPVIKAVRSYTGERFEYVTVRIAEPAQGNGVDVPAEHTIWLQQALRGGTTGIWSVVTVGGSRISDPSWTPRLPFRYGHVVETSAKNLYGGLLLPDGAEAVSAWSLRAKCGAETRARRIYYHRGWTTFQVNEIGVTPWCLVREQRDGPKRSYRGYILIARGEDLRPTQVRGLFRRSEPPDRPILDLIATTVRFGPDWQGEYLQQRAWSVDPDEMPVCPDHRIELADPSADQYLGSDFGAGVSVEVRAKGACRIRERFELSISSSGGSLDQPAPHSAATFVRGEPPRDTISAAWIYSNVCARGRTLFTVRGAGQQLTFPGHYRSRGCQGSDTPPRIEGRPSVYHP